MTFDPYYKWLGIPPEDQPPNHYRLLGLTLFEQNRDAIDNAADRQMSHVRTFQSGPYGPQSQQLLNEIAAARLCLLDSHRKQAYDDGLRAEPVLLPPGYSSPPPVPSLAPTVVEVQYGLQPEGARTVHVPKRIAPKTRPPEKDWTLEIVKIVAGGIAGIVLATLLLRFVFSMDVTGLFPIAGAPSEPRISKASAPQPLPRVSSTNTKPAPTATPIVTQPQSEESPPIVVPAFPSTSTPEGPSPPAPMPQTTAEPMSTQSVPAVVVAPKLRPGRLPVPPESERQAAEASIEQLYELAAVKNEADKVAKAHDLLKQGRESSARPAEQCALYRRAALLAAEGGNARLVVEATDALAQTFDVDVLAYEAALLGQAARRARAPEAIAALVTESRATIRFALGEHQFDIARQLADEVREACDRPAGQPFRKFVNDGQREIVRQKQAWIDYQAALGELSSQANDPAANLAAARWWILERGDWDAALPYLSRSGDPLLLAAVELDKAKGQDRLAIATAWFAAGKAGAGNPLWLARAKAWYLAINKLEISGLDGATLERRLAELALDEPIKPFDEQIARGRGVARLHHSFGPIVRRHCVLLMSFDQTDHFHDGKNWMVCDRSGQQNHGAVHGAAAKPGKAGLALEFAGSEQYVECPDQPSLNPASALTICAWVWNRAAVRPNGADDIVSKEEWGGGSGRGFCLRLHDRRANFNFGSGPDWLQVQAPQPLPQGEWQHLAGIYDGQNEVLLVNGVEVGSQSTTKAISASPRPLRIGRGPFADDRRFHGLVDEVAIFDMALTAADIQAIVNLGREGRSLSE